MAATTLVLLIAAACGGDGDNGGGGGNGTLELPPAGEYQFNVEATMEIDLSDDLVSAAPLALQQSQTVDLSGTATFDFEPSGGTFNIPEFGISGTITIQGDDVPIQITENPDVPSTGTIDTELVSLMLSGVTTVQIGDDTTTWTVEVDLEGPPPQVVDGDISGFAVTSPDGWGPVPASDPTGYLPVFQIISLDINLEPIDSDTQPDAEGEEGDEADDVDEEQLSAEEEAYRLVVGPFGLTPQEYVNIRRFGDPRGDFIYSIFGTTPGLSEAQQDVLRVFAGIFDLDPVSSQGAFGNTVFPCDTLIDGRRTVCPDGAGPVPPGEVIVLAMVLDGDVPMEDPDHFYTYAAVFDADGDPANNFQYVDPYNWDYFQNTDLWYQLQWDPTVGQWQLFVSSFVDQIPQDVASNARVVIAGNVIVFFIPIDEFAVPRPAFRLTAFGHDGTFAPEASGGDVTGADPTEPLLELPAEAIVIDEVEDVAASDGGELVPVEPPEFTID